MTDTGYCGIHPEEEFRTQYYCRKCEDEYDEQQKDIMIKITEEKERYKFALNRIAVTVSTDPVSRNTAEIALYPNIDIPALLKRLDKEK